MRFVRYFRYFSASILSDAQLVHRGCNSVRIGQFVSTMPTDRFITSDESNVSPHRHEAEKGVSSTDRVSKVASFRRCVPKNQEEADAVRNERFAAPADSRFLAVSILGSPNAGKSTLTNALMGWRICSVSKKVHTTIHNTKAVLLEGNTQILLLDTPGLVTLSEKRRHNLEMTMITDAKSSMTKADLVIVIVDVSNVWTRHRLDPQILQLLDTHRDKLSVLVLNKIDLLKSKRLLLEVTDQLTEGTVAGQAIHAARQVRRDPMTMSLTKLFKRTERLLEEQQQPEEVAGPQQHVDQCSDENAESTGPETLEDDARRGWPLFQRIFMISATGGDGVDELKAYLLDAAKPRTWVHQPSYVTDQSPQEIVVLAIREKLLDALPKEIPYQLRLSIHAWDVDAYGVLRIAVHVRCPKKHHVKLVIGPQGQKVRQIADAARQELMNTFQSEISLKLIVEYQKERR